MSGNISFKSDLLSNKLELSLRTLNESCNNPLAGEECANNCDDIQLGCIEVCLNGDWGNAGSAAECAQSCARDEYKCVDGRSINSFY